MTHALLITTDEILAAQFHKMCAVTQSELVVAHQVTPHDIADAYRVFVDQNSELEPFSHDQVVILAPETSSARTWSLALQLNAQHVEVLPSETNWLLEHLVPPTKLRAHIVAITPVVGGAGASTVACALAGQYATQGLKVCLVDADPRAGGLDVIMGCEQASGMRWVDLVDLEGSVDGAEIYQSLIITRGVHLVAPKRGQFDVEASGITSVIETVATACDVVIIDTPRLSDDMTAQLHSVSDDLLLVMPTTVQASSLVTAHRESLSRNRCGLVARQIPGSGLTPVAVAQALDIPLRASLPTDARIVEQVEQGLGLTHVTLGSFSRTINQLSTAIERDDVSRIAV